MWFFWGIYLFRGSKMKIYNRLSKGKVSFKGKDIEDV